MKNKISRLICNESVWRFCDAGFVFGGSESGANGAGIACADFYGKIASAREKSLEKVYSFG